MIPTCVVLLQVCRRWQLLCHTPSLWSAKPLVGDINNIQDIPRLIKSLPFLNLLHLKDVSDPVFQAILAHPNLQEVDLSDTNMYGLDPMLLHRVVEKVPNVRLDRTVLTMTQVLQLLEGRASITLNII